MTGQPFGGRYWTIALILVLAAAIARLWLVPISSSFWLDETATAFVVRHGPSHWSFEVAPQVPASLYYLFPKVSTLFSQSEVAYRVPSLLFAGVTLWLVAKLAARLIHPAAGWFAAFATIGLRSINYQAADARPYAMVVMVVCAATWFLVRWLDDGKWKDAAGFIICSGILPWVHLTAWPTYIIFGIYVIARLLFGDTPVGWKKGLLVLGLAAASVLPVIPFAMGMFTNAASHVFNPLPQLRDFRRFLGLGYTIISGIVALLIGLAFRRKGEKLEIRRIAPSARLLIVTWWVCQPAAIFAFSHLTGNSIFVGRYLAPYLPGLALLVTAAVGLSLPERFWKPAALVLGVGVLYLFGQWREPVFRHDFSDWRGAANSIRESIKEPGEVVFCPSGFIEAKYPLWQPDYRLPSFLYSPLDYYPLPARTYPLPHIYTPEAGDYVASILGDALKGKNRFFIYGGDRAAQLWHNWFTSRPELQGWSICRQGIYGNVEVVLAERLAMGAADAVK